MTYQSIFYITQHIIANSIFIFCFKYTRYTLFHKKK